MTEICQSMRRLYAAASQLAKVTPKPAPVARLLNEITQTVKNWESRGVPDHAAIKAQRIMGVDAAWIKEEEPGEDLPVKTVYGAQLCVAEPLPAPYIHPNETTRRIIAMLDATDEAGRGAALHAVMRTLREHESLQVNAG